MNTLDPATLDFLTYIKKNNNKQSFELMRPLYEQVRDQRKVFTSRVLEQVKKIDDHIPETLEHRACMFRIYRDARFTKWINPYKPNFGFAIWPDGKKSHYPSYYIHIEPGGSFVGGGVYFISPAELYTLRLYLSRQGKKYETLVNNPLFKKHFGKVVGDELSKAPRWFELDDPYINLIKKKQHLFFHHYTDKEVLADDFTDKVLSDIKAAIPFVHFLSNWY